MPRPRDLAADLLLRWEVRGDRIREGLLVVRESLPDPRDRGLLTELSYGVVRRLGTLDAVLARFSRRPLAGLDPAARVGMRLALHQTLFLDRVPAHAAVDQAVSWVRGRAGDGAAGYVNGVLRSALRAVEGPTHGPEDPLRDAPREDGSFVRFREPVFPDPSAALAESLGARFSMPPWLVARWLDRRGASRTAAILRAGIARPPVALRARGDPEALRRDLLAVDPGTRVGPVPGSLLLPSGEGGGLAAVRDGRAWVQDPTAQRVAPLLDPRPGMRLLDLCAAPGGKALHAADLLGGRGEVVACDVDPEKAKALEAMASVVPAGVSWRVVLVPPSGPLPFEARSFDAVLVDAPCTNTAVLRRRVEARWRLQASDVATLAALQRDLVLRALPLVRPGGRLVYATCSLEPEENAGVVAAVVAEHRGVAAETAFDVPPSGDCDGGFAAVLRTEQRNVSDTKRNAT
jgi:16S rRNA (cytosine967-C5)-methyltransferase